MEYREIFNIIKEEFPEILDDYIESFKVLNEVIVNTYNLIGNKSKELFDNKDFEKTEYYLNLAQEVDKYHEDINSIIIFLNESDNYCIHEETPKSCQYDDILECTLSSDFTYKKPYAFQFLNEDIILVNSWKLFFVRICQELIKIDENKIMSFIDNVEMNGRTRRYFSLNSENMIAPACINQKLYVETNQNSNSIRDLIKKALIEYGFKTRDIRVYLKKFK